MGILGQTSNYQNFIQNNNIIPDYGREYKNEYLFIRGIDKTCEKFIKRLDMEGKIFNCRKANRLVSHFNRFLKAQQIKYLNDISELYLKEKDVRFIVSLELQLVDYMDLYYDPDSYEFDQEKYDNNIENDYPGFKDFFECFSRFQDKLNISYFDEEELDKLVNLDTESESESESDDGVDSDNINNIISDDDEIVDDDINNIFRRCFRNSETDSDSDSD